MNFMTTLEASKRLYTTPYTVRKYIRQGKLAAARIGKHYLISEEKLMEFLQSMVFKAGKEEG